MERSPAVIAELAWKCLKGRFRRVCEAIFESDACESALELFAASEACVVVIHLLPPLQEVETLLQKQLHLRLVEKGVIEVVNPAKVAPAVKDYLVTELVFIGIDYVCHLLPPIIMDLDSWFILITYDEFPIKRLCEVEEL